MSRLSRTYVARHSELSDIPQSIIADHTGFLDLGGTRAMTGGLDMGSNPITNVTSLTIKDTDEFVFSNAVSGTLLLKQEDATTNALFMIRGDSDVEARSVAFIARGRTSDGHELRMGWVQGSTDYRIQALTDGTSNENDLVFTIDDNINITHEMIRLGSTAPVNLDFVRGPTAGNVRIPRDSADSTHHRFTIGLSDDLQFYHDSTNSVIDNSTGELQINNTGRDIVLDIKTMNFGLTGVISIGNPTGTHVAGYDVGISNNHTTLFAIEQTFDSMSNNRGGFILARYTGASSTSATNIMGFSASGRGVLPASGDLSFITGGRFTGHTAHGDGTTLVDKYISGVWSNINIAANTTVTDGISALYFAEAATVSATNVTTDVYAFYDAGQPSAHTGRGIGLGINSTDNYIAGSLSIGKTTAPAITGVDVAGDGIFTGSVQGNTFTDGTATLTSGDLTGLTSLVVDNITIDAAAITSDTGTISFSDEDVTTSGSIISTGGAQTGKFLTGSAGNTVFAFSGDNFDIRAGNGGTASQNVLRVTSVGNFDFKAGNLITTGKINFRDTDISIGSTLTDGILDITADFAIDMFFDNVDRGEGVDGQHLNINRRAAGDDYISLFVNANRKGLIGFSGDDDLLVLAQEQLSVNGIINVPKASTNGIKVDIASPTFGFADLLGDQFSKNTGATKPTLTAYNGAVEAWQFGDTDEAFMTYHIPHDHVSGTDIHLHIHWSQNATGATGGTVDFRYTAIYAKGHNQASGSTFTSTPITATFSSIDINDGGAGLTQYQQHLTEVTISAATATSALFDRDDFEPDGVIELTFELVTSNLTGTPSIPFVHYVDIHYQTTSINGTKSRTPDFYV